MRFKRKQKVSHFALKSQTHLTPSLSSTSRSFLALRTEGRLASLLRVSKNVSFLVGDRGLG